MRLFLCNKKVCNFRGKPCWLIDEGETEVIPKRCQWSGEAEYRYFDFVSIQFKKAQPPSEAKDD